AASVARGWLPRSEPRTATGIPSRLWRLFSSPDMNYKNQWSVRSSVRRLHQIDPPIQHDGNRRVWGHGALPAYEKALPIRADVEIKTSEARATLVHFLRDACRRCFPEPHVNDHHRSIGG